MSEKHALILRAEIHEFEFSFDKFQPLHEPQVVLVYEIVESSAKHRITVFPLSRWTEKGLPEPEDFVGHLLTYPIYLETLVSYWKQEVKREYRPVLAVDFDGVIAEYDGWKGDKSFGEPLPGVRESLRALQEKGYWICIWTTREPVGVQHYCTTRSIPVDSINSVMFRPWSKKKVCANVYLDDRGMKFPGIWSPELVQRIIEFQPWWKKPGDSQEDFKYIPPEE